MSYQNQSLDLGFPKLPTNWKQILYHTYTRMYAAMVLQFPRIHRNTLVVQSINFAKHCCEQSNLLWTAEEHCKYHDALLH